MSTLKQRFDELTKDRPRGWKADLARHCQVKPPSVSDWASGRTLTLEGSNLLGAASFFGVNPEWLRTGRGSKYPTFGDWPLSGELLAALNKLSHDDLWHAENALRAHLKIPPQQSFEGGQKYG